MRIPATKQREAFISRARKNKHKEQVQTRVINHPRGTKKCALWFGAKFRNRFSHFCNFSYSPASSASILLGNLRTALPRSRWASISSLFCLPGVVKMDFRSFTEIVAWSEGANWVGRGKKVKKTQRKDRNTSWKKKHNVLPGKKIGNLIKI